MDGRVQVKQEIIEHLNPSESNRSTDHSKPTPFIDLCRSDSDSDTFSDASSSDDDGSANGKRPRVSGSVDGSFHKKKKKKTMAALSGFLPLGFLDPLPIPLKNTPSPRPLQVASPLTQQKVNTPSPRPLQVASPLTQQTVNGRAIVVGSCKHFWKAGDYEGAPQQGDRETSLGGMDHVRIHPRFLHSNATSHKWVLGAFAELLDNALDEVCNGATFVNVDMLKNGKDGSRMLLVEDNGGGMDPDKMRQCMSLGYSAKSKLANTIGQYGNGFKTSTMRLGADVIVFSRCCGKDRRRPTQSIGLLSYTFLRGTGKEDIVVPMLDYESGRQEWNKMQRCSASDWNRNLETILRWSPFSSEADLLQEFNQMEDHGTRIIIYNLWEDDHGQLELDFDADAYDIQIRGVNRDEKNILMSKQFPNSKHFLTYRHSLRSYASILYLRLPPHFQIILRGKDVEHHNIVNDLMMTEEITYRPQTCTDGVIGVPRDPNVVAVVTMGFVKDAESHIDVQGFNVYHKNRLIKPFWRIWNACGSDGRGVIGVLEANFVEPAHDKQGFERTIVLSRLEARLVQMQRTFWTTNCHKVGYSVRCYRKNINKTVSDILGSQLKPKQGRIVKMVDKSNRNVHPKVKEEIGTKIYGKSGSTHYPSEGNDINGNDCSPSISKSNTLNLLKEANERLTEKLKEKEEEIAGELLHDIEHEKERGKSIENKIELATQKIEALSKEQDSLVTIFAEERVRRDSEEEDLISKLKKASDMIQELLDRARLLESM